MSDFEVQIHWDSPTILRMKMYTGRRENDFKKSAAVTNCDAFLIGH